MSDRCLTALVAAALLAGPVRWCAADLRDLGRLWRAARLARRVVEREGER